MSESADAPVLLPACAVMAATERHIEIAPHVRKALASLSPVEVVERDGTWVVDYKAGKEPPMPTRDDLIARHRATLFDCGQIAREKAKAANAKAANAKGKRPKQVRLDDVPRACWSEVIPGVMSLDLYRHAVESLVGLNVGRAEAERMAEEEFARGWKERYRRKTGKPQDLTPEEKAMQCLATIESAKAGEGVMHESRKRKALRVKQRLDVKVKLRYEMPER